MTGQYKPSELKPCPFCPDSGAFLSAEYIELSGSAHQENFAECHSCGVRVHGDITACCNDPYVHGKNNIHPSQIDNVTNKWNTRTPDTQLLAQRDELLAALKIAKTWGYGQPPDCNEEDLVNTAIANAEKGV